MLIGLIGANIQKSLSPMLHDDALAAAGIRGHYHLMDLERLPGRTLTDLFGAVRAAGFAGVNVTFPCKEAVVPLIDAPSTETMEIGSANTVIFDSSGRSMGFNTDRVGFRRNVEETLGPGTLAGGTVVLTGAGGAGRAVAFALFDLGAARVMVHDLTEARAQAVADDLRKRFGARRAEAIALVEPALADAAMLVNATPIGMTGYPGTPVAAAWLRPGLAVADIVYTPIETELIRAARARGAAVVTGGGMCVHQAAEAFRLFTGIAPDIDRMKRVFAAALARRDRTLPSGAATRL